MPSTPSSSLKLNKQATGENSTTWGVKVNDEVIELVDEAIAQQVQISLTGNHTLSSTNYASNESRHAYLRFADGGLSASPTVTAPPVEKWWWITNEGSTYPITFGVSGGVSVTIPAGKSSAVLSDGTDCEVIDLSSLSGSVPIASLGSIANLRVVGNTSGSPSAPSEIVIYDEDNMASDSATGLATQQSIKAYIDALASSGDLATVAGISTEVQTVAANDANITTVANNDANITTVATNIGSVNSVAANMADILNASAIVDGFVYDDLRPWSAITTNSTVAADGRYVVSAGVTVTLPVSTNPLSDGVQIDIWPSGLNQVLAGNGRTIEGETSVTIDQENTGLTLVLISGDWKIRRWSIING